MKRNTQKHNAIFRKLSNDVIYPIELTAIQQKISNQLLKAARKKTQEDMTDEDRLISSLLQLKFKLEFLFEEFNNNTPTHKTYKSFPANRVSHL